MKGRQHLNQAKPFGNYQCIHREGGIFPLGASPYPSSLTGERSRLYSSHGITCSAIFPYWSQHVPYGLLSSLGYAQSHRKSSFFVFSGGLTVPLHLHA